MRARGAGLQAGIFFFFFSDLWPGTQILHHRQRAVAQPGSGAVHLRAAPPVPRGTVAESLLWLFCRPQTKAPFMPRRATCLPCAAPPLLPVTLASLFLPSLSGEGRACCTESALGAWELLAQA